MAGDIPDTMAAVVAHEPGGPLTLARVPVPKPGPGEALVRLAYAPINPADLSVIEGRYGERASFPIVPGAEGSGRVVAAGPGLLGRFLVGRRVACAASPPHPGTWAEYLCTSADRCIPLAGRIDLGRGAMLLVNPLTALALLEIARRGRHRAVVNVAAAGALGRMITRTMARAGRRVIATVRRPDQVDTCRADGAEHVLLDGAPDVDTELRRLAHELGATLLLDPVAGDMTERLLAASPQRSTVVIYGTFEPGRTRLDPRPVLYGERRVEGFFLPLWARDKDVVTRLRLTRRAQRLLGSDLATHVRERVPLSDAPEAVERYRSAMSGGKVLVQLEDADPDAGPRPEPHRPPD